MDQMEILVYVGVRDDDSFRRQKVLYSAPSGLSLCERNSGCAFMNTFDDTLALIRIAHLSEK